MRSSKTLKRIRAGQSVRMCSLGHFIPAYIKLAADFGFDCIWLDAEHRTFTDRELQTLLAHFHAFDIDCLLRTPTLEKSKLYRYLEDGATGVMIPHVSDAAKARALVQALKFPPIGDRGLDGVGLDAGFRWSPEYVAHANQETFLVVQIETPKSVQNVDDIAAVEGVDVLFVGPGDLGLRIQHNKSGLTLEDAFERVAQSAKAHGKAWGTPAPDLEAVIARTNQGAQLLSYGGDYTAILRMLESNSAELEKVFT